MCPRTVQVTQELEDVSKFVHDKLAGDARESGK